MPARYVTVRPPRGRCPSCHKLGLGKPRETKLATGWYRARDCRYCGEMVMTQVTDAFGRALQRAS